MKINELKFEQKLTQNWDIKSHEMKQKEDKY